MRQPKAQPRASRCGADAGGAPPSASGTRIWSRFRRPVGGRRSGGDLRLGRIVSGVPGRRHADAVTRPISSQAFELCARSARSTGLPSRRCRRHSLYLLSSRAEVAHALGDARLDIDLARPLVHDLADLRDAFLRGRAVEMTIDSQRLVKLRRAFCKSPAPKAALAASRCGMRLGLQLVLRLHWMMSLACLVAFRARCRAKSERLVHLVYDLVVFPGGQHVLTLLDRSASCCFFWNSCSLASSSFCFLA